MPDYKARSPAQKRVLGERKWKGEGIQSYKRLEYQVAMELSARWPIKALCEAMSISRSGYYKWKARIASPKAESFKTWLAQAESERLDEIADSEKDLLRGGARCKTP